MKKLLCVTLMISAAFLFACAKKGEQKSAGSAYVIKIGSEVITEEDVRGEMKGLPPQIQAMFQGQAGVEKFIEELIKKEVLYQEAKKKGLENTPEFKKKVDDFRKLTLISLMLEKEIEEQAKVSEKEAREYYDSHKADFAANSQIKASHILVKTEEDAKKTLEQIKKGADFAAIAKEKSIDTGSAKNGGDLGFFSRGQMVPEFEKAAFGLKKGEVSGPVKTQYGYHIIKVTDKKEGTPLEFDKIKEPLTQRVTAEKQKSVFDTYVTGLRNSYKIEINKEAVSKIASPVTEAPAPPGPAEKK